MIFVEKPDQKTLDEVLQWPVWEKEPSQFDWDYTEKEVFYILQGCARLVGEGMPDDMLKQGDLVTGKKGIQVN